MKTRPSNPAYLIIVWLMLGLLPLHAAPIPTDGNVAPKWITDTIWTSSATLRSHCEEAAKYAVISIRPEGVSYQNENSSLPFYGDGATNLLSQIADSQIKFSAKSGDPGYAHGYVYAAMYDEEYNLLFTARDEVGAISTDAGWKTEFNLGFDISSSVNLPLASAGDEIDGVQVYILDSNENVVKTYWLSVNWDSKTVRYPTGLTGDLMDDRYDVEIVFHRWNQTVGSYSQSYDLKTGIQNPIGEVTAEAGSVSINGMILSTTTAEVNPVSSNGFGTLPLVVLSVKNTANFVFSGKTTEGEKATGFRIRKLGPTGYSWQEHNLPTDSGASLMQLDPGTYHIEYVWPSFREEERWIYDPWENGDGLG